MTPCSSFRIIAFARCCSAAFRCSPSVALPVQEAHDLALSPPQILYLNTQAAKDAAHKERCASPPPARQPHPLQVLAARRLNLYACTPPLRARSSAKELLSQTPAQELQDKLTDIRLGTALCALTVLRYLTDHMHNLPLCVLVRGARPRTPLREVPLRATHVVVLSCMPVARSARSKDKFLVRRDGKQCRASGLLPHTALRSPFYAGAPPRHARCPAWPRPAAGGAPVGPQVRAWAHLRQNERRGTTKSPRGTAHEQQPPGPHSPSTRPAFSTRRSLLQPTGARTATGSR